MPFFINCLPALIIIPLTAPTAAPTTTPLPIFASKLPPKAIAKVAPVPAVAIDNAIAPKTNAPPISHSAHLGKFPDGSE